jgi:predicted ester cyclase
MHLMTTRRTYVAAALASPFAASVERVSAQQSSPTSKDIEAIARAFYQPFNSGDMSASDRILAENWVDHPLAPGQPSGREGYVAVEGFRMVFPDLHITNDDVIVARDKVTVRSTARGTQDGELLGIPRPASKLI